VSEAFGDISGRSAEYDSLMPQTSKLLQPEILLLCDSAKIARAIEMILRANGHLQILLMDQFVLRPSCDNHWDLILIAFSKVPEKPLDVVRQACLFQWVGCCQPMLIIAPDPIACPVGEQVWYLEFPFEVQTLSDRVTQILPGGVGPQIECDRLAL
jgi:hypothetical protein